MVKSIMVKISEQLYVVHSIHFVTDGKILGMNGEIWDEWYKKKQIPD